MNQKIQQFNEVNKYNKMISYLNENNEYWLKNDKWDMRQKYNYKGSWNWMDFSKIANYKIKLELKYTVIYILENKYMNINTMLKNVRLALIKLAQYLNNINQKVETLNDFDINKFKIYLHNIKEINQNTVKEYIWALSPMLSIINEFFDDREETEKDVWNCLKIHGTKISATCLRKGYSINFLRYPNYYKNCMKRYFRTIITKKSLAHCLNIHIALVSFFENFRELGYTDGFLKELAREDIEKYVFHINCKYKGKDSAYVSKMVTYPRTFLEYIQLANYEEAPIKEISRLIFQDDIPKREKHDDTLKKIKFVPTPILQQLDGNIMQLDRPELIPIYILLRETGWRGTDIFNLRYDNCLEKIWNGKEEKYNYYLCGEITKTGISQLKIPIRDTVAQMLEKNIQEAKELSNGKNNPNRYLFNVYDGKLKGRPIPKDRLMDSIRRLVKQKNIKDENGNLFHFKLHSLRHTRAKEYVEQGINISIIQQMLGHRSLQMTIHYATVTENTLYEQWKNTENLNLFKINTENGKKEKIVTKEKDDFVRYEFVRKNLDAVKVPFGVCFKHSKLPCKHQINQCLTCSSFCTTTENINEYKEEIKRIEEQIRISKKCGRILWQKKNEEYLELLNNMVTKIETQHIVHKNGNTREEN